MDFQIALLLGQDGIVNGAVYGLMALALVLVFSVTRVIFIPQGEFVAFGALTMVMLQAGRTPATLWLLLAMGATAGVLDGASAVRKRQFARLGRVLGWNLAYPLLLWLALAGGFWLLMPRGVPGKALAVLLWLTT